MHASLHAVVTVPVVAATRSIAGAVVSAFALPPPPRPWPLRTPGRGSGRPRDLVWLLDVIVAVVLTSTTAAAFNGRNEALGAPFEGPWLILAGFALGLSVVIRDRAPIAAWRLTMGVSAASALLFAPLYADVPLFPTHLLAVLLTSYTAVVRADRPIALGVWLVSMLGLAALVVPAGAGAAVLPPEGWVAAILALTAPIVLGYNVRTRRRTQDALVDERRRTAAALAEQAVLEERARIARELHDVVAHHMTLIAIQAEAAPLRSPDDAAALSEDLGAIRTTALTALTETRRILGLLRDGRPLGDERAPAPGISEIAGLVDAARTAGHQVTFDLRLDDAGLSPGTALSVHRIVQESVSNVLRHAPGADLAVTIGREAGPPPAVVVDVTNGPPATTAGVSPVAAPTGNGHGLVGMRERVAMLDGRLQAEPTAVGGYRVHATIPEGQR